MSKILWGFLRECITKIPSSRPTSGLKTGLPNRLVNFLRSFQYFALLDAGCTNTQTQRPPIDVRTDSLEIWFPASSCSVMCVTDVVAANGFFPTNFTNLCHGLTFWMNVVELMEQIYEKGTHGARK
jgi:hypothetical protein